VHAAIGGFVAAIGGTVYTVIAVNRRAGLAIVRDTCFLAVAVYSVTAVRISEAWCNKTEIYVLITHSALGTDITAA
jgi:hypothetical protein